MVVVVVGGGVTPCRGPVGCQATHAGMHTCQDIPGCQGSLAGKPDPPAQALAPGLLCEMSAHDLPPSGVPPTSCARRTCPLLFSSLSRAARAPESK